MVRKFFVLFVLAYATPAFGQPLERSIDALFAPWDTPATPGAALAITQGDSIYYARGYGVAQLEYGVPITPSTVFMVASVSKQFTAYAVALLAAQGALDLDDPVREHVPELHDSASPITIRQLVYHTSGLRDEFGLLAMAGYRMDDVITKDDILRLAYRQRNLNFEPGTEYLYSNTGYTLLAEITERVTGESFSEWTRKNVFVPLGMRDSHFRDDHNSIVPDGAQGYLTSDSDYKAQLVNYASVGASGLYTTALDLAKWLLNLKHGTVGGETVRTLVHERGVLSNGDTLAYAFGLSHGQFRGTPRIGHSGSHRSFRTWAGRFPEHDLGIVVLSNLEEFDPSGMALRVAGLFVKDEGLAALEGTYYSEETDATYTLSAEADTLRLHTRRGFEAVLERTDVDTFTSGAWFLTQLKFRHDAGRIAGFEASSSRTRNVWFRRLDP